MRRMLSSIAVVVLSTLGPACQTPNPTHAVLDNEYPSDASVTVFEGWWSVALFLDPVPPGRESTPVRVVEGSAFGYALLAPGWSAETGAPTRLIPVRSRDELSVERGDTLHFRVAPATIDGDCASGEPLSQDDADFITQRIFPGAFAGMAYDAATCSSSPVAAAAGGSGGADSTPASPDSGNGGQPP